MANLGYIQITRLCNQKCRFCSNPEREATITITAAREQLKLLKKTGYTEVILTGGEPSLFQGLAKAIRMARGEGLECRIITNGQKTADRKYLASLIDAGLQLMHVSLHSCRDDVQAFLTENPDSLKNLKKTLRNACHFNLPVNINTVINKYNADHLDENVRWVADNFPCVYHFVWNNIDPLMNRASLNRDVIPRLRDFEISLARAAAFLESRGLTFRIERVPLCYMPQYAHCSTETRKIVKNEERTVHFLDERGSIRQMYFTYEKAGVCDFCFLNEICAGLYEMDTYYDSSELYPLFIPKETVIEKVLASEE